MFRAPAPIERNSFLVSLLDISRNTFAADDLRALARRLLELTLATTGFTRGCVYYYDREVEALRPLASRVAAGEAPRAALSLDAELPEVRVALTGQPALQVHGADARANGQGNALAYDSIFLPLLARGSVVGVMGLAGDQPSTLDKADLDLMGLAANQIAVSIENARLYEESLGERAKVRAIVDACADGIMVVDVDGRIVDVNPSLERITGLDLPGLLQHSCAHLLGACTTDGRSVCDVYCPVRLTQEPPQGEVEARLPGGDGERWVGITYGLLRDTSGQVSGVVHTIRDISAHKSAQKEIVASGRRAEGERRRLQAIIDNLPEGVCIAESAGGNVVLANRKAFDLLGSPECLLTGGDASTCIARVGALDGAPTPSERLPLARSLEGEVCEGVQLEVRHGDDKRITLLVNSAPLLDGAGAVTGAVAAFQDITGIKEVERMKDSFVAAASHELRTPVTSIRGYAQLLLRRIERDEGRNDEVKATKVILRQVDRLVWLVNHLLEASRAQKGELGLVLAPCDLGALAAEVVERKRLLSDRHQIRLEAAGQVIALADANRVEQVLVNLLNNAIEYSPKGGPVDVRVRAREGQAEIAVEDRGIGIPAGRLEGIFQRFYCAHSDLPRSSGGLGLGLYVSYQIVARHGGNMWVESRPGEGSVFTFALPVAGHASDPVPGQESRQW